MKKVILIFICFSIITLLKGQSISDSFIQSSAYISFLKRMDSTLVRRSGTGFLIFVVTDSTNKRGKVFLVTNKHVLPNYSESKIITVKIPYKTENDFKFKEFNVEIYDKLSNLKSNVKFHKDHKTDVAIIDVTSVLIYNKLLLFNSIPSFYLCTRSDVKKQKIGLGDEVLIIGYPSSIYDNRTVLPIVRQGIISTDPTKDFYFNASFLKKDSTLPNPLQGFLVDGSIFPGSSGSMVVLKTSLDMEGKLRFYKKPNYILGIISSNISLKDQSIDIGLVFSAECILELINEF